MQQKVLVPIKVLPFWGGGGGGLDSPEILSKETIPLPP